MCVCCFINKVLEKYSFRAAVTIAIKYLLLNSVVGAKMIQEVQPLICVFAVATADTLNTFVDGLLWIHLLLRSWLSTKGLGSPGSLAGNSIKEFGECHKLGYGGC